MNYEGENSYLYEQRDIYIILRVHDEKCDRLSANRWMLRVD